MTELLLTDPARQDLLEIWLYIAKNSYLEYADKQLELFLNECELLTHHPQMGSERAEIAPGVRCFPVNRYNIYYRYQDDKIYVLHIVAAAQNITEIEFAGATR